MDTQAMIRAEREDLVGLCKTLTPEQWDTQSLCTEWKVRHVVGHLVGATEISAGGFLAGLAKNGFNLNKTLARDAQNRGDIPTDELLAKLQDIVGNEKRPPGVKVLDVLFDSVAHAQDIRRPLGIPRAIPEDRLRAVADHAKGVGFPLGIKKRIAGVRLNATDVDWTHGDGPEASGPLEAILMVMGGRPAALADLAGEGRDILSTRLR